MAVEIFNYLLFFPPKIINMIILEPSVGYNSPKLTPVYLFIYFFLLYLLQVRNGGGNKAVRPAGGWVRKIEVFITDTLYDGGPSNTLQWLPKVTYFFPPTHSLFFDVCILERNAQSRASRCSQSLSMPSLCIYTLDLLRGFPVSLHRLWLVPFSV